jgi:hypothetical protein
LAADSASSPPARLDEERVSPPLAVLVSAHFRARAAVFCWEPVFPQVLHSYEPEADFREPAAVYDSEEALACSASPRSYALAVRLSALEADSHEQAAVSDSEEALAYLELPHCWALVARSCVPELQFDSAEAPGDSAALH